MLKLTARQVRTIILEAKITRKNNTLQLILDKYHTRVYDGLKRLRIRSNNNTFDNCAMA